MLAAQWPSPKMSACGRKALTLLSSVFAVCGLGLLGIAVSTDYWLYLEEGIILPQNQSTEVKMSLHSGLWRVCFLAGKHSPTLGNTCPKGFSPYLETPRRCREATVHHRQSLLTLGSAASSQQTTDPNSDPGSQCPESKLSQVPGFAFLLKDPCKPGFPLCVPALNDSSQSKELLQALP